MKTEAARGLTDSDASGRDLMHAEGAEPLGHCVRAALRGYLENMADHRATNLYALVLEEVERPLFEVILAHTDGNLSQASKILGMTRSTLRKRLSAYGIERGA